MISSASRIKHVILFDASCSLCCRAIERIKGWDHTQVFFYAPLDGELGCQFFEKNPRLKRIDSLIFIENYHTQKEYIWLRGRAVMRILWIIGGAFKLIGWLAYFPLGIDLMYRFIARHRHH